MIQEASETTQKYVQCLLYSVKGMISTCRRHKKPISQDLVERFSRLDSCLKTGTPSEADLTAEPLNEFGGYQDDFCPVEKYTEGYTTETNLGKGSSTGKPPAIEGGRWEMSSDDWMIVALWDTYRRVRDLVEKEKAGESVKDDYLISPVVLSWMPFCAAPKGVRPDPNDGWASCREMYEWWESFLYANEIPMSAVDVERYWKFWRKDPKVWGQPDSSEGVVVS